MFPQLPFGFQTNVRLYKGSSALQVGSLSTTSFIGEVRNALSSMGLRDVNNYTDLQLIRYADSLVGLDGITTQTYLSSVKQAGSSLDINPIIANTLLSRLVLLSTIVDLSPLSITTVGGLADPDAQAVITAIEATGVTLTTPQSNAIIDRVLDAKSDGVWTKWLAYYGFVGGTAASHAINWKSPSTNLITWNGGVTHDANGVRGNGTTGYGDTGLSMSTITFGSAGMGFYSTDIVPNAGIQFQMGAALAGSNRFEVFIFGSSGYLTCGGDLSFTSTINDNSRQYFSGNSISTTGKTYKNGSVASTGTLTSASLSNRNIWLLASNRSDIPYYSTARLGSACINTGLTDAEETANYISELAFQTTLGRN